MGDRGAPNLALFTGPYPSTSAHQEQNLPNSFTIPMLARICKRSRTPYSRIPPPPPPSPPYREGVYVLPLSGNLKSWKMRGKLTHSRPVTRPCRSGLFTQKISPPASQH